MDVSRLAQQNERLKARIERLQRLLDTAESEGSLPADQYRDIQMTAAWCGRTVAAMQVWDVLRAVEWGLHEEKLEPAEISLYGKGEMGIIGLYATLRDQRIGRVILKDPPASHWQGPALLNILRITDVAEAAGALAPRRIIALTPLPASFDLSRALYQLEGAADHFSRAGSISEALTLIQGRR